MGNLFFHYVAWLQCPIKINKHIRCHCFLQPITWQSLWKYSNFVRTVRNQGTLMNKISTYAQYLNKIKSIDSQKIAFRLLYWMNLIWFRRFHSQLICFCTTRREFAILCVIIKSLFLFITSSLTLTTFRNISWEAKSLCFSSPSNQSRWRMETTNHDRALLCWRYTFKKTNHQHNLIKFPN